MIRYTLFLILIGLMCSCGSRKEMVYLQPDSTAINTQYEQFIPKIQSQDILTITVTASDPEVTAPFNPISSNSPTNMNSNLEMALRPTYTVDVDGNILFPMLGKVKLGGLTRLEAIALLREKLSKYINEPNVNMNYNNFRVTVLGEVAKPGSFIVPTERITVLEALGLAGDLTNRGIRTNVMVVREIGGQKIVERLDLTQQNTLNSPFYYLAQNDVVYVEPNKAQINNAKLGANTNIIISIASLLITVISVLTR